MKKMLLSIAFSIAILSAGLAAVGDVQTEVEAPLAAETGETVVLPWQPAFLLEADVLGRPTTRMFPCIDCLRECFQIEDPFLREHCIHVCEVGGEHEHGI